MFHQLCIFITSIITSRTLIDFRWKIRSRFFKLDFLFFSPLSLLFFHFSSGFDDLSRSFLRVSDHKRCSLNNLLDFCWFIIKQLYNLLKFPYLSICFSLLWNFINMLSVYLFWNLHHCIKTLGLLVNFFKLLKIGIDFILNFDLYFLHFSFIFFLLVLNLL